MVFHVLLATRRLFPVVTKFLGLVAVICATASPAYSSSITLSADRDTLVMQLSPYDTYDFGAYTQLPVGNVGGPQRAILGFGMTPLATALSGQDFTVQSVTLRLHAAFDNSGVTLNPEVHAISAANQDWVEGTGLGTGSTTGTSSWAQKQQGTANNWAGSAGLSTAITDYATTALATQSLTTVTAGDQIDFVFSGGLYALINGWLTSNPGLLIYDTNENTLPSFQRLIFASRENTTYGQPQLIVEYTPIPTPEPTSCGLMSLGLLGLMAGRRRSGSSK